ncbi:helix-turn-helix domain-containing protein [Streptomyces chrestomyceticus]|uniref:helix-turn-helix domain-containing protein n=1 Tax=Streptomyces chrestomyceticus TaxID=68185 RepID=UPI0035A90128
MSDFQQARAALGARLRELREACPGGRLTGTQLAARLGWPQSKISRLENGKQTATVTDLQDWAKATEQPGASDDLLARLRGLESHVRSWRRQLASGHQAVQDAVSAEFARSKTFRAWESAMIVGALQTGDYARAIFTRYAELQRSPQDTDAAVRARLKWQENLYRAGTRYHILMWEGALRAMVCPPQVLAAQLDRLAGVIGLDTLTLGIVPFGASLKIPPANGFWIFDERLVIAEDWHAELWIDEAVSISTYLRTWDTLRESAVYGADAHSVISRARRALGAP